MRSDAGRGPADGADGSTGGEEMELAVKQTLNASGVSVLQIAPYLAFGREIWKKTKHMAGETLAREAAVLIAKGVARGLTAPILQAIRSEVFNVPAPIAP